MFLLQQLCKMVMAIWTVLHITYLILIALLTGGATDFNGNPNHLSDHLITASIAAAAIIQAVLLSRAVRAEFLPGIVMALMAVAFIPWVAPAVAETDLAILLIPLVYSAIFMVPYAGYRYFGRYARQTPGHDES